MSQKKGFEDLYSHDRHFLHEVVPLDTPYSVNIEPASYCNIKCVYCVHSLPHNEIAALGYSNNYCGGRMTEETFSLLVHQLKDFPQKISSVTFGGVGEPLLHKQLPQMIAEIKKANVCNRINLITNGILLSEETSLSIIDAGLDSMKISLQGIDAQAYKDTCGYNIDFEQFLSRVDFLFKHKTQCSISIKVPDISLYRGEGEQELLSAQEDFKKMFGDKCDKLGIEHIVPCFPTVDYRKVKGMSGHTSRYNIAEKTVKVCSQPFYRINVMQNGSVTLCTMLGLTDENMNIHNCSLQEIWNGESRRRKLIKNLQGIQDDEMKLCQGCNVRFDFAYEEDYLDPYADEIMNRILDKK